MLLVCETLNTEVLGKLKLQFQTLSLQIADSRILLSIDSAKCSLVFLECAISAVPHPKVVLGIASSPTLRYSEVI